MKKVIQIAVATGVAQTSDWLYALTEDGEIWHTEVANEKAWMMIPPIPENEATP